MIEPQFSFEFHPQVRISSSNFRSLFNNAERGKFLNQLVAGVREILQNPRGLTEPNNYHEFCR